MITLSLKEAVVLALNQSPEELAAKLAVDQRRKQAAIALAPLLPKATSVSTAYINRYNLEQVVGPYQVHLTGNNDPTRIGPYQVIQPGGTFSQEILNVADIRSFRASKEDIHTSEYQHTVTREQIVAAVVLAYQTVLRTIATETAAESRQNLADRLMEQADRQLKSGTGTGLDLLRSRVELANEQQRVTDAKAAHREAIYRLTDLLALPSGQEAAPTQMLDFTDVADFERENEIQLALTNRPEIESLRSQERAAHLTTGAAKAQRLPDLSFSGDFYEQGRTFGSLIPAYTYVGTVSFPILDGGRISAETARDRLEEKRIDTELHREENTIREQVKSAFSELEAARMAIRTSSLGLDLAQQEVAQASRRFAAGVSSSVEVTTAQDQLARASDNQIDALFRFNRARAALASATGIAENVYGK